MRTTRVAILTGAAAIVLAGFAGMANAQTERTHVLTLRLPNGQIERVEYTGDVPPTVILDPAAPRRAFNDPVSFGAPPPFGVTDPFAMLDRISAEMDRQAAALFKRFDGLAAPDHAGFGVLPAMSGPGVCMRSVQVTFGGNGQAPHVVSQTSGNCAPDAALPAALPNAPAPKPGPDVIQVKAAPTDPSLVHAVADWRQRG
jgi:hypothetical protein